MNYDKITSYFETEGGLENLINDYKDLFNQIDDVGGQFLQGILTTSEDYRNSLNFATGAYVSLAYVYSRAEAYKLNEELRHYVERKRDAEAKGEKVVAASLEKEASLDVADLRRVRNIIEGYVLATEKIIVTSQTQLKRLEEDNKYKQQEER